MMPTFFIDASSFRSFKYTTALARLGTSRGRREGVGRACPPHRCRDYINDIHYSGTHLPPLINDVLDVARIEQGELRLNDDIVRTSIRLMDPIAARESITLEVDIDDNLPILHGGRHAVHQIVFNLLSNAVKFTDSGGTVTAHVYQAPGDEITVVVKDAGIGIPANALANITEPFVPGGHGRAPVSGFGSRPHHRQGAESRCMAVP